MGVVQGTSVQVDVRVWVVDGDVGGGWSSGWWMVIALYIVDGI